MSNIRTYLYSKVSKSKDLLNKLNISFKYKDICIVTWWVNGMGQKEVTNCRIKLYLVPKWYLQRAILAKGTNTNAFPNTIWPNVPRNSGDNFVGNRVTILGITYVVQNRIQPFLNSWNNKGDHSWSLTLVLYFYCPPTKLQEGNVSSCDHHSVHRTRISMWPLPMMYWTSL